MRVLYDEKSAVSQLPLSYKLIDLRKIPWHTKWNGITVTRFLKVKRFISKFSHSQYYMGVAQNMISISTPQTFIIMIIVITLCKGSTFLPVISSFYFISSLIFGKWFYLILAFF